jgi:hypothetical protein
LHWRIVASAGRIGSSVASRRSRGRVRRALGRTIGIAPFGAHGRRRAAASVRKRQYGNGPPDGCSFMDGAVRGHGRPAAAGRPMAALSPLRRRLSLAPGRQGVVSLEGYMDIMKICL